MHEDEKSNTVTAIFELPGLKKEDVNIDVHNNVLTISGETKVSEDHDENGWAVRERRLRTSILNTCDRAASAGKSTPLGEKLSGLRSHPKSNQRLL